MTDRVRLSKRMSRVLRHDPGRLGIALDDEGWTPVDALVAALGVTRAEVEDVVTHGSKQRFRHGTDDTWLADAVGPQFLSRR